MLKLFTQGHFISMAVAFSVLVLMKHLFLPLAPLFALYLVVSYCKIREPSVAISTKLWRFFKLAIAALSVLTLAFGPFIFYCSNPVSQIIQIFRQLFPFNRGLVHAYWAPNIWALYMLLDRALNLIFRKIPVLRDLLLHFASLSCRPPSTNSTLCAASATSGLVGSVCPAILPNVSPVMCMILVVLAMMPNLLLMWSTRSPSPRFLILSAAYCSLCAFMFGYHVHEKAILVPMICLSLVSMDSPSSAAAFLHVAMAGVYSLFPLFTTLPELFIKRTYCTSPNRGLECRSSLPHPLIWWRR